MGRTRHRDRLHERTRNNPTYNTWRSMKMRCLVPTQTNYARYGARGITICERWVNSFENFLADMGERPEGTSLDRYPNRHGNYEPGNCRWATPQEQSENKDIVQHLEYGGESLTIPEWSKRVGFRRHVIDSRLKRGWSVSDALTKPIRSRMDREVLCESCGITITARSRTRHEKGVLHQDSTRIRALLNTPCISFATIGNRVGLTRERVRQIANQIKAKAA